MACSTEGHTLFLTGTSNPQQILLPVRHKHSKIFLMAFTLKGASVTAGVPDFVNYNLKIENTSSWMQAEIRSDYLSGTPLPITGAYTHEDYSPPKLIASGALSDLNNFKVSFTDSSGNPGLLTAWALWLKVV